MVWFRYLETISFLTDFDMCPEEVDIIFWVAIINAKFQIRQRRNHQCSKPPNFKPDNAATDLT